MTEKFVLQEDAQGNMNPILPEGVKIPHRHRWYGGRRYS